ncbi:MAG TPA: YciI-like protein [Polyangiaceae bacterium]
MSGHFLLSYDLAPDYLERRGAFRDEHLRLAWEAHERGELVLAGALADPADGAVLVFRADSTAPVEAFVAADPYVCHGLVSAWRIRSWTTVVGRDAATPVRPAGSVGS